ncbi:MAG: sigma-70 family RNA polymerase sigma factor [Catenulispora sp.]|nr:sigma-70 family RNA polymerase sigma factor [Catenulispora sp.]
MVVAEGGVEVVAAAAAGDAAALERLVGEYLPLVYNIVGRALPVAGDVDDVVQETMLRVVRGLPGLREAGAFRSWLVAVAMNQVRDHVRGYQVRPRSLEEVLDVADPGADFADLTLTELGLTGQRREVAMATSWLDPDDRELLSLWWLAEAGHLTRGELVAAIRQDPHHVTVRIARMKAQLEISRAVVRALCAVPICFELSELAMQWHGRPEAVWRKRFARHVRQCHGCAALAADFVPAERLLVRLALVPVPFGTADAVHRQLAGALRGGTANDSVLRSSGPHSHRRIPKSATRTAASHLAAKAAVALAATAAVVGAVVVATGIADSPKNEALSQGSADSNSTSTSTSAAEPVGSSSSVSQPSAASSSSSASTSSSSKTSSSPATHPDPSRSSTSAKPSASSKPAGSSATGTPAPSSSTTVSVTPPVTPPSTPPSSSAPAQSSPEDQVLAVINQARAAQGLPALTRTAGLDKSAAGHTDVMASGCGLSHQCPGEPGLGDRETAAGVSWSAAGENIGEGGPVSNTNDAIAKMAVGLTNSMLAEQPPNDGHRRNILSSSFHHIGISIFRDSSGTVWMTQDFSD